MACSTAIAFWQGIADLDRISYDLQSMGPVAMKSSGVNRCLLSVLLLHVLVLLLLLPPLHIYCTHRRLYNHEILVSYHSFSHRRHRHRHRHRHHHLTGTSH
jgi:hypothetical protein